MLKWIIAALALLNVALFLWATGHKGTGDVVAREIINPDSMRLLSEVRPEKPVPSSGKQSPLCFRVGPFLTEDSMVKAGEQLTALTVPYETRTVPAREIRAHRVFLGPFNTPTAITAQRQLLTTAGITDHYVKRGGPGEDVISLGLFSQKAGAEVLQKELLEKQIKVQIRAEDTELAPTYWLELRDQGSNRRSEATLRQLRWQGNRAQLRQYSCS